MSLSKLLKNVPIPQNPSQTQAWRSDICCMLSFWPHVGLLLAECQPLFCSGGSSGAATGNVCVVQFLHPSLPMVNYHAKCSFLLLFFWSSERDKFSMYVTPHRIIFFCESFQRDEGTASITKVKPTTAIATYRTTQSNTYKCPAHVCRGGSKNK